MRVTCAWKNIYNKGHLHEIHMNYFASLRYGLLLKKKKRSLWEQILSFKSNPYFGSDSRHILSRFVKIIPFWLRHCDYTSTRWFCLFLVVTSNVKVKYQNVKHGIPKLCIAILTMICTYFLYMYKLCMLGCSYIHTGGTRFHRGF